MADDRLPGSSGPCDRCADDASLAVVVEGTSPQELAELFGRDYITPEDVALSAKAGHDSLELCLAVLDALEGGAAEDPNCCAFVARNEVRKRSRP